MPRAFGDDRIVEAEDGVVTLETRVPKGWEARVDRTALSVEHPGTAVRWEEEFWEVRSVVSDEGVVRYALTPWDERHIFRAVSEYSEAAEEERARQREELVSMRRRRHLSLWLALLAGHLPGRVQQSMEEEFGAPAARITMISAVPLVVWGWFCIFWLIFTMIAGGLGAATGDARALSAIPSSMTVLVLGAALGVESTLRFGVAFLQGRPAGSAFGLVAYEAWRIAKGKAAPPTWAAGPGAVSDEQALQDSWKMREPLAALLSPAEQVDLLERFDFDPIAWGRRTAVVLLVFFGLFAWRALALADVFVLVMSGALAAEQVARLVRLARGEAAGSVLGALARPFLRRFLGAPPPVPPDLPAA
jgi:hypothetical protein